jgi:hypothetical protein
VSSIATSGGSGGMWKKSWPLPVGEDKGYIKKDSRAPCNADL